MLFIIGIHFDSSVVITVSEEFVRVLMFIDLINLILQIVFDAEAEGNPALLRCIPVAFTDIPNGLLVTSYNFLPYPVSLLRFHEILNRCLR